MSHRAGIYTVKVHPRYHPKEYKPLGDIDGSGTSLLTVVNAALTSMNSEFNDRCLRFDHHLGGLEPDEAAASLRVGEKGVTSTIDRPGDSPIARLPPFTENIDTVVYFKLPPTHERGFLVVHVPFGRGSKLLLDRHLAAFMQETFGSHTLVIEPVVPPDALRQAVDDNKVRKVRLLSHSADAFEDATKWVPKQDFQYVELVIHPKKLRRIIPDKVRAFLDDPAGTREQLFEFAGMTFEEVKVEVELPDGKRRSFNIERPEAGHAVTADLEVQDADSGYPTAEELLAAMKSALADVTGPA